MIPEHMGKRIETENVVWNVVDHGKGAPLLLVHGFPLDLSMWRFQIEPLSKRVRVIAPDLPGFGQSRLKRPGAVTLTGFADQLAELLDALGIDDPVCFCGLSMGGYVGWQFWKHHRRRLGALIACDTKSVSDTPEVARARELMARSIERDGTQNIAHELAARLFSESTFSEQYDLVDQVRRVICDSAPNRVAGAHRAMAARPDVTTWLSQIDVPTLIVVGERDAISTPEEMLQISKSIPNSSYFEIAGAGHMVPLEKSVEFNKKIAEFLDELKLGANSSSRTHRRS